MKNDQRKHLTELILSWYERHQRRLPWRQTQDPYRIWVSEIMLQQTQVDTVIPYYNRFLERFPTVRALARASQDEVLKAWENMGYYARARHLHEAAKEIVERLGGRLPDTWEELSRLPGIGQYTAGAILSIAFGQPAPALDGNARRLLIRIFAIQEPPYHGSTVKHLWELAQALVPDKDPGRFNQALMDLGASICTPRNPSCQLCPIQDDCGAHRDDLQDVLPLKKKRRPVPHVQAAAGVIRDLRDRLLISQRPRNGLLGGLWKFPGGRQGPQESLEACLRRHIWEELGIQVRVGRPIASVDHTYTHFRVTLHAFHCVRQGGEPRPLGCSDWRWVGVHELDAFAFSKVDRMVIRVLGERSET